ncbi:Nibrin [Trichinella pseudospiralis]
MCFSLKLPFYQLAPQRLAPAVGSDRRRQRQRAEGNSIGGRALAYAAASFYYCSSASGGAANATGGDIFFHSHLNNVCCPPRVRPARCSSWPVRGKFTC